MALVKFGAGIVQMLGSIGGTTFARNASGNYARAKTKPVDPHTDAQDIVRSAISVLTEYWRETLTAAQRTAWATYAAAVAMQNRLGETIHLSGFNHFIRSNVNREVLNLTVIAAGPTELALPSMDPTFACTGSAATNQISVAFDNAMDWAVEASAYMFLFQGQPQNATRNFFAGPYGRLGTITSVDPGGPATPSVQGALYTLIEGQRVWVRARINRADGRLSEFFLDSFIVAA